MNPFLIVAIVAGFCALLVYPFSQAGAPFEAPRPVEVPPQYEAQLIEHDRQAIEAAYRQHVQSVFATWMKDDTGQPARAVRGVNVARKAYVASMLAIEDRIKKQESKP